MQSLSECIALIDAKATCYYGSRDARVANNDGVCSIPVELFDNLFERLLIKLQKTFGPGYTLLHNARIVDETCCYAGAYQR